MDNKKTLIGKIEKMINDFFSPKNVTDTLADGRVITVETEDGDWTGKRVTTEDGQVLAPGTYPLADGRSLVVGDDGVISQIGEAQAKTEPKQQDMEMKKQLEEAQAKALAQETRIKELESALEAQSEVAAKATAKAKTFENKLNTDLKVVQEELARIKNTTVGDTTPPALATKVTPPGTPQLDGMQKFFKQYVIDPRNTD